MANPWDVLPFDPKGDADAETVYRAVGHALSGWELIVESDVEGRPDVMHRRSKRRD